MTRCISIILTLCLILAAIPEAHASNVEQSLVVGIQSNKTARIRPLDPEERDFLSVYDLMYESLVVIDDNYMPQPGLAESWEVSPNGRTWTFKLRSGITFHDGSPLRADDVVATMQYILNRAGDEVSANRGYYRNLKYFVPCRKNRSKLRRCFYSFHARKRANSPSSRTFASSLGIFALASVSNFVVSVVCVRTSNSTRCLYSSYI